MRCEALVSSGAAGVEQISKTGFDADLAEQATQDVLQAITKMIGQAGCTLSVEEIEQKITSK